MASNYVSLTQLKEISTSLDSEKQEIMNTYKNQILPVLNSSEKCFHVAGLNTNEIISSFDTIFKNVDGRISALTDALNNNVIKQYSEISAAISQMFNNNFASELKSLLSIICNLKPNVYHTNLTAYQG